MSESEFKKIRLHLRLLTICVVVLIVLFGASLIHTAIDPKTTSFPKVQTVQGPPGKDAVVNYDKINQLIKAQIAVIPPPQNGVNGRDGSDGKSIRGPQGTIGAKGDIGPAGTGGKDGESAPPAPVLQVRTDPITCQLQQKYDTNDFWISFVQLPKPCEVL